MHIENIDRGVWLCGRVILMLKVKEGGVENGDEICKERKEKYKDLTWHHCLPLQQHS